MRDQRIDKGSALISRSGMHDEPGRLVDHNQTLILINNLELNLFTRDRTGFGGRLVDAEAVACANLRARVGYRLPRPIAAAPHVTAANKLLQPRPA